MLFMVVERFKNADAVPVYRRFRQHGRQAPASVQYVDSWVSVDLSHCYQLMDAPDRASLDAWIANWTDLVNFDVVPVITSAQALETITPRL